MDFSGINDLVFFSKFHSLKLSVGFFKEDLLREKNCYSEMPFIFVLESEKIVIKMLTIMLDGKNVFLLVIFCSFQIFCNKYIALR